MKKQLFLSLLFLPTLLFSQTLREFDLQEMNEQQIPVFIDYPNDAAFIFYTAIIGFTVESNTGGVTSIQSEASKVTVFLKPERQILTLKAPGFIEKKLPVENLSAKQAKFYRVNGREDSYQPENGSAKITTDPAGCQLLISGIPGFKEKTPYEMKNFEARKYRINLTKPDYFPLDTLIEIKAGIRQDLIFRLKSKFGTLSIKASAKVRVKISGQGELDLGQTYQVKKLPVGTYTIEVNDPGFDPLRVDVTLESGETKLLDLPLVKKSGFLQISHPEKFSFTANGVTYYKEVEPQLIEFLEGSYKAIIKRSGFKQVEFSFVIKKGSVITWNPDFLPEMASLNINSTPEGADVYLISGGKEKFLGFTPVHEQVQIGSVQLLIKKEGFPDYNFTANLDEGQVFQRTIDLKNPEGKKVSAVVPPPVVQKPAPAVKTESKAREPEQKEPEYYKSEPLNITPLLYLTYFHPFFKNDYYEILSENKIIENNPGGLGLGLKIYFGKDEFYFINGHVYFSDAFKTKLSPPLDEFYLSGASSSVGISLFRSEKGFFPLYIGYGTYYLGEGYYVIGKGKAESTNQLFIGTGMEFIQSASTRWGFEYQHSLFAQNKRIMHFATIYFGIN